MKIIHYILWFGAMLYLLLAVIIIDIFRFSDYCFHYLPNGINGIVDNYPWIKPAAFIVVSLITSGLLFFGYLSAEDPVITEQAITIHKPKGAGGEITIALVTDIHMGSIIKKTRTSKRWRR